MTYDDWKLRSDRDDDWWNEPEEEEAMTNIAERLHAEKQQMSFDLAELRAMLFSANAEIERLRSRAEKAERNWKKAERHMDEAAAEIERLHKKALQQIVQWSDAYPLDVFPEPDFAKAAALLKAGGMTLDAISASNMRHVVDGVAKIARDALIEINERTTT